MKNWRRKGDGLVTSMPALEAELLRGLVGQVKDMLAVRAQVGADDELAKLTGMRMGPTATPESPLLARLLPDFQRVDLDSDALADVAVARSVHEPEIVEHKTAAAQVILDTTPVAGGKIGLTGEQAQSWLSALTDVRLVLGTAVGVTEEMPEVLLDDDPRSPQYSAYQWLTWMQDSLVQALMK